MCTEKIARRTHEGKYYGQTEKDASFGQLKGE
jgi:hypothetical protein